MTGFSAPTAAATTFKAGRAGGFPGQGPLRSQANINALVVVWRHLVQQTHVPSRCKLCVVAASKRVFLACGEALGGARSFCFLPMALATAMLIVVSLS